MLNLARVLAIAFVVSAAATAWLGSLAAQCTDETNGCGDCQAGQYSSRDYLGGIECEHGNEYDPDCDENNPDCCELHPGGCTGAPDECNCYTCGNNGTCEGEFRTWLCHCGQCSAEGFESAPAPGGECADCTPVGAADAIIHEYRDMTGSCDPGENFWMLWVFFCGEANSYAIAGNCLAIDDSACVVAENADWVVQNRGQRHECNPGT